jgi:hypothetical protein
MEWLIDTIGKVLIFAALLLAVIWVFSHISDSWFQTVVAGAVFVVLWWRGWK